MFIKQLKIVLVYVLSQFTINLFHYAQAQKSIFPTQVEQVNLITSVYELTEQINESAKIEQYVLEESMEDDMELIMKNSQYLMNTLEELTLLKLSVESNSVCSSNSQDNIKDLTNKCYKEIEACEKTIHDALVSNFLNLNTTTQSAIKSGENFLDKLNSCSEKRGFAVIGCYKKVIENDVTPVKNLISFSIDNHRDCHIKSYGLKEDFNQCIEKTIENYKKNLDLELQAGINCA